MFIGALSLALFVLMLVVLVVFLIADVIRWFATLTQWL